MKVINQFLNSHRSAVLVSVSVALTVSLYFVLILPSQTFLANANEFLYTFSDLLQEYVLYFVLTWVVLSGVLFALTLISWRTKKPFYLLHCLCLAATLAAMVESGPLSIGLPVLDGEVSGYCLKSRGVWDGAVYLGTIILFLACYRLLRKRLVWMSLIIAVFAVSMVLDTKCSRRANDLPAMPLHGLTSRAEVVKNAKFSSKRNVLVLILDAVSPDAARDVFTKDKHLRDEFSGFVNYTNNLGMHWNTVVAIPGIMTGDYYEHISDLATYGLGKFSSQSFAADYLKCGCDVFLNLADSPLGYMTTRRDTRAKESRPSKVHMFGQYPFSVNQLSLFRIIPYACKAQYLKSFQGISDAGEQKSVGKSVDVIEIDRDAPLWGYLASRVSTLSSNVVLNVHHSVGGHLPIDVDADGRRVNIASPTYDDYVSKCVHSFRQVSRFFSALKKANLYDEATIVLMGDHGAGFFRPGRDLKGIPSRAFPCLMVKPSHSLMPYVESDLPTSLCRIAEVLRKLVGGNLSRKEIERLLHTEKRLCRTCEGDDILDWIVDEGGQVEFCRRRDEIKSSEQLSPLETGKDYSFKVSEISQGMPYPECLVTNGKRGEFAGMALEKNPLRIVVKALRANVDYDVCLDVRIVDTGKGFPAVVTASAGEKIAAKEGVVGKWIDTDICLSRVRSLDNGIIKIDVFCDNQRQYPVLIGNIRLDDAKTRNKVDAPSEVLIDGERANNKNYAYADITKNNVLVSGSVYRLHIDRYEVLAGRPQSFDVRLYDFRTRKSKTILRYDAHVGDDGPIDFLFRISESGNWKVLFYAGNAGNTAGNVVKLYDPYVCPADAYTR